MEVKLHQERDGEWGKTNLNPDLPERAGDVPLLYFPLTVFLFSLDLFLFPLSLAGNKPLTLSLNTFSRCRIPKEKKSSLDPLFLPLSGTGKDPRKELNFFFFFFSYGSAAAPHPRLIDPLSLRLGAVKMSCWYLSSIRFSIFGLRHAVKRRVINSERK